MARFPLGQPVRLALIVRDPGGTLNSTTPTVVVKIRNADGTQTTTGTYAAPTLDSTGNYHQDVPSSDLAATGHYQWTSAAAGMGLQFGEFDIFDPFEPSVLPLADAMDALNITTAQRTAAIDAEVAQYVATIESCLERSTGGPLVNTTISERAELTAGYTVLQVRQRPLVSVTSIVSVASGTAIDISAGLDIDVNAGTIRRKLGYPFYGPFFTWLPAMTVTYVAGWGASVPAAFSTAGRIILQNLWETQHGPSARPQMGAGSDMVTMPGWGFAIPNQAAELLDGSLGGIPFLLEAYL